MHTIDWKLTRLKPYQSDIFKTLDEWFDLDENPFMEEHYLMGTRFYKEQVNRFRQADYRDESRDGPTHWRTIMCKRLLGLRRMVSLRTAQMDRYCKLTFPLKHTCFNHYWLIRNCRPYGGEWEASYRHALAPNNPTGHPCGSRYCPWCYLRRFDCYLSCLLAPRGTRVWYPLRLKLRSQGLPELVNVTSFDTSFTAPVERENVHPDKRSLGEMFLSEPCSYYIYRAQKLFTGIRLGPADPDIIRFVAPLYDEKLRNGTYHPVVGIRVGFIHTDQINPAAKSCIPGLDLYQNVTVGDALRWVYPFPLKWFRTDDFLQVKTRLILPFHKLYHHGITADPSSRIRYGNVHS